MRAAREILREAGRSTATVTAATAIGVGIHEACGYIKGSAVSFFNQTNNNQSEKATKDVASPRFDF